MLPESESIQFEGQTYVNPEASLNEQNAFIDNLRGLQNQNNAEINTQTYNLGTAVPSNLGGLVGGEGYFTARYQTPQGVSLAANLDAVARAQAQNEVLNNQLSALKQRYNNAYKAAQRRAAARSRYVGGGDVQPTTNTGDGSVTTTATDDKSKVTYGGSVTAYPGTQVVISPDGIAHVRDEATGEIIDILPPASSKNTGVGGMGWSGGGGEFSNINARFSGR